MNLLSLYKIPIFSHSCGDTLSRNACFTVYFSCFSLFCLFLCCCVSSLLDFCPPAFWKMSCRLTTHFFLYPPCKRLLLGVLKDLEIALFLPKFLFQYLLSIKKRPLLLITIHPQQYWRWYVIETTHSFHKAMGKTRPLLHCNWCSTQIKCQFVKSALIIQKHYYYIAYLCDSNDRFIAKTILFKHRFVFVQYRL